MNSKLIKSKVSTTKEIYSRVVVEGKVHMDYEDFEIFMDNVDRVSFGDIVHGFGIIESPDGGWWDTKDILRITVEKAECSLENSLRGRLKGMLVYMEDLLRHHMDQGNEEDVSIYTSLIGYIKKTFPEASE